MGPARWLIAALAAALSLPACGPGLARCPGMATIAAWHDEPASQQPATAWISCASSFDGCAEGHGDRSRIEARAAFCRAMALRASGDETGAILALEEAASLDPGWAAPHAVLGAIALGMDRAGQAVAHLETAVSLDPAWPDPLNDLGLALLDLGQLDAALARFDAALALDPLMASAHANRAGILAAQGLPNEAIASYLSAMDLEPGEPMHVYNLAGLFEDLGEHDKASAAYGHLLDLLPMDKHAAVHLKIGRMEQALGNLETACEEYQAALELAPTSAAAMGSLAALRLELGEHEQAWELFHALGKLDPDATGKMLFSLGSSLIAAGELGLASRAYGIVVEIRPDWPEPYMNLGAVMTRMGAMEEAVQVLEKALALVPGDAGVLNNMGIAYARMHRLEEAEAALVEALEADPGLVSAHSHLGEVLRIQGRLEDSLASHDRAVSLSPQVARLHARRARTLVEMKRLEDARDALETACELDPDDPTTSLVKGIALLSTKKKAHEAVEELHRAVELDPTSGEAHAMLALALLRTKKAEEAREHLETALDVDPYLEHLDWVAKLRKKLG